MICNNLWDDFIQLIKTSYWTKVTYMLRIHLWNQREVNSIDTSWHKSIEKKDCTATIKILSTNDHVALKNSNRATISSIWLITWHCKEDPSDFFCSYQTHQLACLSYRASIVNQFCQLINLHLLIVYWLTLEKSFVVICCLFFFMSFDFVKSSFAAFRSRLIAFYALSYATLWKKNVFWTPNKANTLGIFV